MLVEVRHVTRFDYAEPVRESVMELWMQPQKSVRQRLVSFDLEINPAAQVFSYTDAFGNAVYHFDVPQPHNSLTITAKSAVETQAPAEVPASLDSGEWDRLRSDFITGECFDFLYPHGFAVETPALHAFIEKLGLAGTRARDPLTAVRELARVIYEKFDYEAGVTRADSPIDDVLKAKKGVCQDFAHLMIAACRAWGIPARYVSGYLFTDRKSGDRSDPDASHAWVEVFLPSLRWVGFDPTNNIDATERHITCAIGRDYSDVPPTRGVFKGETESTLGVGVSVKRARQAFTEPEFLRVSAPAARSGKRRPQTSAVAEQPRQQQQ